MLGSDINVYGTARAIHEKYGIKSIAYSSFQLAPTKYHSLIRLLPGTGVHFTHNKFFMFRIRETGEIGFCIEEDVPVYFGGGATQERLSQVISDGNLRRRLSLTAYFGWYGNSDNSDTQYVAVQQMIWEEFGGTTLSTSVPNYATRKSNVTSTINSYNTRPSFHGQRVTLKVGETVTLTDSNGIFANYAMDNLTNTANVTLRQEGNRLHITAHANSNESGSVAISRIPKNYASTPLVYRIGNYQGMSVLYVDDPINVNLNIDVLKEGHAEVLKVDEDTGLPLAGAVFCFETSDGQERELTTGADGKARWENLMVDTTVTIEEITAPNGYVINSTPQTLTIRANETTTVTFDNQAQVGQLELLKTVETAIAATEQESDFGPFTTIDFEQRIGEGFEFKIRPTEDIVTGDGTVRYVAGEFLQEDGQDIVWTTDEEGRFTTEPILHIGKYEIVEVGAPNGVVLLEEPLAFEIEYAGQTVDITSAALEVENFLQEINIYGQKQQETIVDWEEGQAVIELENANNGQVFALRLAESLTIGEEELPADTTLGYSVVEDGVIRFENLRLPNQVIPMYLQEIEAGADHVLDETKHTFVYDPENNEISFNINVVASQPVEDEDSETEEDNADTEESENIDTEGELEDVKATTESTEEGTNEPDSDLETEVEEESVSEAIINRLARANVKVIKTDGMDSKPLEGVEFDLIRIDEVKDVELEEDTTDNETVESEDTEEQDVIEAASETKETTESDDSTTEGSETEDTDTDGTETEDSDIQDPGTEEDQENVSEVRTVVGTYTTI